MGKQSIITPNKGYRAKYYLYINYAFLIVAGLYIVLVGFNLWSLVLLGLLMNSAMAFNDVANDTMMVKLEQKHNLKGRIQAIQWISLAMAGLIVSLGGAWIAKTFPEPLNYKLAYAIWLLIPVGTIIYLVKHYRENKIKKRKTLADLKLDRKHFKNKEFMIGLLFIAFLRFSPSFGRALMIHMREVMGVDKMFIGYLGVTGTVLGLIGYALYYWKAYKLPMKKLLYFTVIFSAIANLLYLYIHTKWHIMGYNIAFGAIDGVCFLTILALMAKIVPAGAEGLFYALITGINNFASRLGGIAGGMIFDNFGYSANVVVASATTLMCLVFIPFLIIRERKEVAHVS
jgi:Na+/melibiose symporter-like transporter